MSHNTGGIKYVRELIEKFPDAASLQIAKLLMKKYPKLFLTLDSARAAVRYARGASGSTKRKAATHVRELQTSGYAPKMPASFAEEFSDFELGSDLNVGILCDAHIPYHNNRSLNLSVRTLKKENLDILILNGDWADFYQMSRYDKNPHNRKLNEEIKELTKSLAWLRKEFPKTRIIYKLGNHEERWDKYLYNHAPILVDLPNCRIHEALHFNVHGIELVADKRPILLGNNFYVWHGHEIHKGAGVHVAKSVASKVGRPGAVGHSHRSDVSYLSKYKDNSEACYAVGCNCHMHPEYAIVNKWNWGFAKAKVNKAGQTDFINYFIDFDYKVRYA